MISYISIILIYFTPLTTSNFTSVPPIDTQIHDYYYYYYCCMYVCT